MYYAVTQGRFPFTPAPERQIFLRGDASADSAAHKVMRNALNQIITSCTNGTGQIIIPIHLTDCPRGYRDTSCLIGIEEIEKNFGQVSIYPIPASNSLNIELSEAPEHPIKINIFDITGRLLNHAPILFRRSERKIQIDVGDFIPGFYLLKFKSVEANEGVTFIKN
jgi:hypothetical protein